MTPAKPSETARPTYNEDDYDCAGAPVALTFEYGLVNDFLSEWCEMKTKLNNGEISPNEYFEWKITWPHAYKISICGIQEFPATCFLFLHSSL